MTDERLSRDLKTVALTLLALALGAAVYLFLGRIRAVVAILIGATFVAYLIYPAVSWLQRRRWPRWAAIAAIYLAIVLVVGAALAFVGPIIGDQARSLATEFPTLMDEARDALVSANSTLLDAVPLEARQAAANALDDIVKQLQQAVGTFAGQALRLAASFVGFFATLVLVPLLAFYILLDLDRIRSALIASLPARHRERTLAILSDVDGVIGGFVRGQLAVGAVVGVLVIAVLLAFRIKYAVLIGAFAGIADLVPYIGALAGAIPAVLLAAFEHGPFAALALVGAFVVVYELEGHIIAPAIVSRSVGLTPPMVVIAILIGAELGGVGGMFLAVPIAGIVRVLWLRFVVEPRAASGDAAVDA